MDYGHKYRTYLFIYFFVHVISLTVHSVTHSEQSCDPLLGRDPLVEKQWCRENPELEVTHFFFVLCMGDQSRKLGLVLSLLSGPFVFLGF